MLKRDDVDLVINACDAGREGELIFAWTFEKAGAKKPVERLWLSSMTTAAIKDAFGHLRPRDGVRAARAGRPLALGGGLDRRHERHARGHDPAALVVRRRRLARPRADPDAGDPRPPRGGDPRLQARAVLARRRAASSPPAASPAGATTAASTPAPSRGCKTAAEAEAIVAAVRDQPGEITKLETTTKKERAPLLYDLTSLQREANTRFGFSARRTLAAAQRLYEEHKALTYPRTNSRFLPGDMVAELKPTAALVGAQREYAQGRRLRHRARRAAARPRGQRRQGHRPPRDHPDQRRASRRQDERRRPARSTTWSSGASSPSSTPTRCSRTRGWRRRSPSTSSAPAAGCWSCPGWRGVYGEGLESAARTTTTRAATSSCRSSSRARTCARSRSSRSRRRPSRRGATPTRRCSAAMETAGKLVDDDELREAMKDSGIGTPATRAAIIERLIDVGYVEREGRALVATEKGVNVIKFLGEHALTSPSMTGDWEHRLARIEEGEESRERFMQRHRRVRPRARSSELDAKLKEVRIPRANLGPCPVCGRDIVENRKGFSCWSREDPGLRLRDLEVQGRQDAADRRRASELIAHGPHREGRDGLQGPLGPLVPRPARADADRGRQVARRVRRAVGARGRQAARGRGGSPLRPREPRRAASAEAATEPPAAAPGSTAAPRRPPASRRRSCGSRGARRSGVPRRRR